MIEFAQVAPQRLVVLAHGAQGGGDAVAHVHPRALLDRRTAAPAAAAARGGQLRRQHVDLALDAVGAADVVVVPRVGLLDQQLAPAGAVVLARAPVEHRHDAGLGRDAQAVLRRLFDAETGLARHTERRQVDDVDLLVRVAQQLGDVLEAAQAAQARDPAARRRCVQ